MLKHYFHYFYHRNTNSTDVKNITYCPFKEIINTYCKKSAINRSKGKHQNRLFYSMSPVGHRFLENIDSDDPQFQSISLLAKQFSRVLEKNGKSGWEKRLRSYWDSNPPKYPVCSLRDCAFGAVLNEVWFAFFAKPCPKPEIFIKASRNILMVVKDWETVDLKSRKQAMALVFDSFKGGLNSQLNFKDLFSDIHEVIFALIVSAVDELSEGFAHTLICLSQNSSPLPSSDDEFTVATYEALRLYPLFTMSVRPDIENKCLHAVNYVNYHRRQDLFGEDAQEYNWQRWQDQNLLEKTLIFGIGGNRSCPGRNSAMEIIPTMIRVWIQKYNTKTRIIHSRELPCGGLAMVTPIDKSASWVLSWLHLIVWVYKQGTFFLAQKWWIGYRNLIASEKLIEADRYYKTISTHLR
ncbi:hypothetical protein [Okeania sp. SIO2B3]|uniref:hypothetical protein n=1 Tax=Okeania sp. SIO2B3 TaxID=2607784 RepID=UPI0013C1A127|nr:hypothetical protein [Okeania sp. SIO2B3]NET46806.1 hypothetical protein [Okeania sp. SIO2B3]